MGKKTIDWQGLYRKLEGVHDVADPQGFKKKVLEKRGLALKKNLCRGPSDNEIEIVEFSLAHEAYGFETALVKEICAIAEITPIPCAPDFVLGVIGLRGEIISVLDIKKFFGLPEKGLTDLNKVIVLESGEMAFGILADSILGTTHVDPATLSCGLPTLTDRRADYLKGVCSSGTIILDAARILNDEKIVVNETVEA